MRAEDDLLRMVQGNNPMMAPPGMEEGMPPEGPPPGMDMPPEPPPGDEMPMEPDGDPNLPQSARVMEIQGNTVVLQADSGSMHKVPMDAFPIPPQEGMQMVQAIVEDIRDGVMVALVGASQTPIELPLENSQVPFEIGDYFWMPEPPSGPPEEPAGPDMMMG